MLGRSVTLLAVSVLLIVLPAKLEGADPSPVRTSSSSITVSATNAPYLRASTEDTPQVLEITAEDIERGFIDVTEAGAVAFQTNDPDGTILLISIDTRAILSAQVTGAGAKRSVGPAGGWIDLPFRGTMPQRLAVSCRLNLRSEVKPGPIAWPVRLEARGGGGVGRQ